MFSPSGIIAEQAGEHLARDQYHTSCRRRAFRLFKKAVTSQKAEPVLRLRLRAWLARTHEPGGLAFARAAQAFESSRDQRT